MTDCIEWTGPRHSNGYGQAWDGVRHRLAHRVAYEAAFGAIPAGLTIDHLCRNRLCVNPAHLEAVPMRENILRSSGPSAQNARKATCRSGHPLEPDPRRPGRRWCATCTPTRQRARNAERRDRQYEAEGRGPMYRWTRLSAEQVAQALRDHAAGRSLRAIGRDLGVNHKRVARILAVAGGA